MKTEMLATVALASFTVAAAAVSSPGAIVGLFGLSIIGIRNVDCFSGMQTFTLNYCKDVIDYGIWGSGVIVKDSNGKIILSQWDRDWHTCKDFKLDVQSQTKYSIFTQTGYPLIPWLKESKKATVTAGHPSSLVMNVKHYITGAKATFPNDR